jgi:histone H3/H4
MNTHCLRVSPIKNGDEPLRPANWLLTLINRCVATLTQMIKEYLPESVRMSQQSSDLLIQLSMHFLNYLSDTSNNMCNAEGKKTITPSHVVKALKVYSISRLMDSLATEDARLPGEDP